MSEFVLVGLSHKTAPLELREHVRLDDPRRIAAELRSFTGEAAILTTCNRVEVYAWGVESPQRLIGWLAGRAGVPEADLNGRCYVRKGRNACKHLFFVASSLDSLIVGETQIRAQVKEAYRAATDAGAVGPNLHRLFQAALRVSKEISESTGVGRGNVSVAGAAADLAERVFGNLSEASVLVLGAGETAELVMNHLVSRSVGRFHVLNRTLERGQALAERYHGTASGFDSLSESLAWADVLLCAAGGDEPVVGFEALRSAVRARRGRPMVVIDIAVPRGVDPKADRLDNVYRYDMETLSEVTKDALRHRRKEFLQCCTLIDAASLRLVADSRAYRAGGAIAALERTYEEVAERELAELERRLPGLGKTERERMRRTVHRIVRKLLHMPKRALRASDPDQSDVILRALTTPEDDEGSRE